MSSDPPHVSPSAPVAAAAQTPAAEAATSAPLLAAPATPPEAPEVSQAPRVPAKLSVERPYLRYRRPHAEGRIQKAGDDEALGRWNVGGTGDPEFISNRPGYHPGARVVVNTTLIAGNLPKRRSRSLTQNGLLAQSRSKGYWPLRICYEAALRRNPKQHGESVVRFSLVRSGRISRARLRKTELDTEAGQCLVEAVEALRYSPGPDSGALAVDLSVEFWPGDAPLPVDGPPIDVPPQTSAASTNTATSSTQPAVAFDAQQLSRVLEPAVDGVRQCYEAGLERDPKLWGRLQVLLEVSGAGNLVRLSENESRFPDPLVTQCVLDGLGQLSFSEIASGPCEFVQAFRLGEPPLPESPAAESPAPETRENAAKAP